MKKFISIFLAFQILATSSPTNRGMQTLLKMGAFFHHFVHHLACQEENIGIMDYVQLHYSDHDHHKTDHAEHEKLPFHHHHNGDCCHSSAQTPCLPPHFHTIVAFPKLEIISKSLISQSHQWHSSPYSGDIWQPPKA